MINFIVGAAIGAIISILVVGSLTKTERIAGNSALYQMKKCEKDLARNQRCKITAIIHVKRSYK